MTDVLAANASFAGASDALPTEDNQFLMQAVQARDVSRVIELLRKQANPNAADSKGVTAMHIAAFDGDVQVIEALLQNGGSANILDRHEQTPLFFAPTRHACDALLKARADLDTTNKKGQTALHLAAYAGLNETVQWLAENMDADLLNHMDRQGRTAYFCAAHSKLESTTTLLQKLGADAKLRPKPQGVTKGAMKRAASHMKRPPQAKKHAEMHKQKLNANFQEKKDSRAGIQPDKTQLPVKTQLKPAARVEHVAEDVDMTGDEATEKPPSKRPARKPATLDTSVRTSGDTDEVDGFMAISPKKTSKELRHLHEDLPGTADAEVLAVLETVVDDTSPSPPPPSSLPPAADRVPLDTLPPGPILRYESKVQGEALASEAAPPDERSQVPADSVAERLRRENEALKQKVYQHEVKINELEKQVNKSSVQGEALASEAAPPDERSEPIDDQVVSMLAASLQGSDKLGRTLSTACQMRLAEAPPKVKKELQCMPSVGTWLHHQSRRSTPGSCMPSPPDSRAHSAVIEEMEHAIGNLKSALGASADTPVEGIEVSSRAATKLLQAAEDGMLAAALEQGLGPASDAAATNAAYGLAEARKDGTLDGALLEAAVADEARSLTHGIADEATASAAAEFMRPPSKPVSVVSVNDMNATYACVTTDVLENVIGNVMENMAPCQPESYISSRSPTKMSQPPLSLVEECSGGTAIADAISDVPPVPTPLPDSAAAKSEESQLVEKQAPPAMSATARTFATDANQTARTVRMMDTMQTTDGVSQELMQGVMGGAIHAAALQETSQTLGATTTVQDQRDMAPRTPGPSLEAVLLATLDVPPSPAFSQATQMPATPALTQVPATPAGCVTNNSVDILVLEPHAELNETAQTISPTEFGATARTEFGAEMMDTVEDISKHVMQGVMADVDKAQPANLAATGKTVVVTDQRDMSNTIGISSDVMNDVIGDAMVAEFEQPPAVPVFSETARTIDLGATAKTVMVADERDLSDTMGISNDVMNNVMGDVRLASMAAAVDGDVRLASLASAVNGGTVIADTIDVAPPFATVEEELVEEQVEEEEVEEVAVNFKIENIEFDQLSAEQQDGIRHSAIVELAKAVGVDPSCIVVNLSSGSVVIDAKIVMPVAAGKAGQTAGAPTIQAPKVSAEAVNQALQTSVGAKVIEAVVKEVKSLPGISAAVTPGKELSAGAMKVAPVERKTITKTVTVQKEKSVASAPVRPQAPPAPKQAPPSVAGTEFAASEAAPFPRQQADAAEQQITVVLARESASVGLGFKMIKMSNGDAVISGVMKGSVSHGKLKQYDILTHIEGTDVKTAPNMGKLIGQSLRIEVKVTRMEDPTVLKNMLQEQASKAQDSAREAAPAPAAPQAPPKPQESIAEETEPPVAKRAPPSAAATEVARSEAAPLPPKVTPPPAAGTPIADAIDPSAKQQAAQLVVPTPNASPRSVEAYAAAKEAQEHSIVAHSATLELNELLKQQEQNKEAMKQAQKEQDEASLLQEHEALEADLAHQESLDLAKKAEDMMMQAQLAMEASHASLQRAESRRMFAQQAQHGNIAAQHRLHDQAKTMEMAARQQAAAQRKAEEFQFVAHKASELALLMKEKRQETSSQVDQFKADLAAATTRAAAKANVLKAIEGEKHELNQRQQEELLSLQAKLTAEASALTQVHETAAARREEEQEKEARQKADKVAGALKEAQANAEALKRDGDEAAARKVIAAAIEANRRAKSEATSLKEQQDDEAASLRVAEEHEMSARQKEVTENLRKRQQKEGDDLLSLHSGDEAAAAARDAMTDNYYQQRDAIEAEAAAAAGAEAGAKRKLIQSTRILRRQEAAEAEARRRSKEALDALQRAEEEAAAARQLAAEQEAYEAELRAAEEAAEAGRRVNFQTLPNHIEEKADRITVTLHRTSPSHSFGLQLSSTSTDNNIQIISGINTGGLAALAGLATLDVLIAIDSEDVREWPRAEVIKAIKDAPNSLEITVGRLPEEMRDELQDVFERRTSQLPEPKEGVPAIVAAAEVTMRRTFQQRVADEKAQKEAADRATEETLETRKGKMRDCLTQALVKAETTTDESGAIYWDVYLEKEDANTKYGFQISNAKLDFIRDYYKVSMNSRATDSGESSGAEMLAIANRSIDASSIGEPATLSTGQMSAGRAALLGLPPGGGSDSEHGGSMSQLARCSDSSSVGNRRKKDKATVQDALMAVKEVQGMDLEVHHQGPELLIVKKIGDDGLLAAWNGVHPNLAVHLRDRLVEVNGKKDVIGMQQELRTGGPPFVAMKVMRYPDSFELTFQKTKERRKIGIKCAKNPSVTDELRVNKVQFGINSLAEALNDEHMKRGLYHLVVTPGMRVLKVNHIEGNAEKMFQEIQNAPAITVLFRRNETTKAERSDKKASSSQAQAGRIDRYMAWSRESHGSHGYGRSSGSESEGQHAAGREHRRMAGPVNTGSSPVGGQVGIVESGGAAGYPAGAMSSVHTSSGYISKVVQNIDEEE